MKKTMRNLKSQKQSVERIFQSHTHIFQTCFLWRVRSQWPWCSFTADTNPLLQS